MPGEPLDTHHHVHHASDRRPAVWPWLLIPLIALTLFFALQKVKSLPPAVQDAAPVQSAAPAEPESP